MNGPGFIFVLGVMLPLLQPKILSRRLLYTLKMETLFILFISEICTVAFPVPISISKGLSKYKPVTTNDAHCNIKLHLLKLAVT